MTYYAYYNSQIPSPSPVIGWINTDTFGTANLPPANDLLELTSTQWQDTRSNLLGWAVDNNALVSYTAPPISLTLSQQAELLINEGTVTFSSTTYPSLTGTFGCSTTDMIFMMAEMNSLQLDGLFTNGETIIVWFDSDKLQHNITAQEFPIFAKAIGKWINILRNVYNTNSGTIPSMPITI